MKRTAASLGIVVLAVCAMTAALAQLPPEIMADRYLVQAERELGAGDAVAAVETLNRIVALQAEHGLEIPDTFWFRRVQAAQEVRLHGLAVESVVQYLRSAGRGGEHYRAALELFDTAELAQAEADARAEAERLAAERAEADRLAAEGEAVAAVAPELVMILTGRFQLGCVSGQDCFDDEFPVRNVTIRDAFAVSRYEVTFAEWDACVLDGG